MMVRVFLFFSIISMSGFAQVYDTIQVGITTEVNLVFQSRLLESHVGLGQYEVDGQIVSDILTVVSNDKLRLSLTAAIPDVKQTNLFVETEDGYYNFILQYAKWPAQQLISVSQQKAVVKKTDVQATKEAKFEKVIRHANGNPQLEQLARKVLDESATMPDLGEKIQKMEYYLNAIYVYDHYLFFRVNLLNSGSVKYDLGFDGFFIRDKKTKGLNKAPQQPEQLHPILTINSEIDVVEKDQKLTRIYVLDKFTLDKDKHLAIEFWEDEGQRRVVIKVSSKDILNAKLLTP